MAGRENLAVARSVAYAVCALAVAVGVSNFLSARDVRPADVWCWRGVGPASFAQAKAWWCGDGSRRVRFCWVLLIGMAGGLALGLLAQGLPVVPRDK